MSGQLFIDVEWSSPGIEILPWSRVLGAFCSFMVEIHGINDRALFVSLLDYVHYSFVAAKVYQVCCICPETLNKIPF